MVTSIADRLLLTSNRYSTKPRPTFYGCISDGMIGERSRNMRHRQEHHHLLAALPNEKNSTYSKVRASGCSQAISDDQLLEQY
jgi:hypothetical protein